MDDNGHRSREKGQPKMDRNFTIVPSDGEPHDATVFHASLTDAVEATISALRDELTSKDDGIVTLIRTYAATMDKVLLAQESTAAERSKAVFIGPQLLKALESIGGTPAARGELEPDKPREEVDPVESLLDGFGAGKRAGSKRGA